MNLRVLWDVFMVYVAVINLSLIAFDLSYLWLRPQYFRYLPVVTEIYDPVKGIEPHPLTAEFLEEVDATTGVVEIEPYSPQVGRHRDELVRLTMRIMIENPFERSGLTRYYDVMAQELVLRAGMSPAATFSEEELMAAAEAYWPSDPQELQAALRRFNSESRIHFEINYHRGFDQSGRLIDWFWLIDLPFLVLFWIEFLVRWYLALRRKTYAKWFFFPIFNWYDILGLLPVAAFRPFRLLRAVSMYMRLRRSELSVVGKDVFSRSVAYISNIITEEVSDRVAIRILSELHEEISDGTHARIARDTVEPRRAEIEQVLTAQIRQLLTNEETLANLRALVKLNLDNAVENATALRSVPLPNAILKPLVRYTGEIVLDTTLETVRSTLESEEGEQAVRDLAAAVLEGVFYGPYLAEIETVAKEISLQVIDNMKDVVAIKKWARPEQEEGTQENGDGLEYDEILTLEPDEGLGTGD